MQRTFVQGKLYGKKWDVLGGGINRTDGNLIIKKMSKNSFHKVAIFT